MGRVEGKAALVTGGASGIGRATSMLLAREGACVAICDVNIEGAAETASEIGDSATAVALDVTSEAGWKAAVAEVAESFDGLHILVNCAGIGLMKTIEDTSFEEWRNVHSVDLDSVFLGCRAALPAMAASGGGAIVNISSIAGIIAGHNMAAYNSAKAGVRHLTKSVALHCARKGYNVRCNSVHPTFIDTPILQEVIDRFGREEAMAKLGQQVPIGRVGEPDDVAYGILYLASDESKFITGAELAIDGGISAM